MRPRIAIKERKIPRISAVLTKSSLRVIRGIVFEFKRRPSSPHIPPDASLPFRQPAEQFLSKKSKLYSDFSMLSILSSSFFKTFCAKLRPPTPKATAKATHRAATTRRKVVSTIFAAIFSWLKVMKAATT